MSVIQGRTLYDVSVQDAKLDRCQDNPRQWTRNFDWGWSMGVELDAVLVDCVPTFESVERAQLDNLGFWDHSRVCILWWSTISVLRVDVHHEHDATKGLFGLRSYKFSISPTAASRAGLRLSCCWNIVSWAIRFTCVLDADTESVVHARLFNIQYSMMLFLYALLYFALSNAIAAAPVFSNVKGRGLNPAAQPFTSLAAPTGNIKCSNSKGRGLNPAPEPFTSLVAPNFAVQSAGFQSPTRNIEEEPRPVQKTRKSGSRYKTVDGLKLEKGSIYSIPRQLVVSHDDHSAISEIWLYVTGWTRRPCGTSTLCLHWSCPENPSACLCFHAVGTGSENVQVCWRWIQTMAWMFQPRWWDYSPQRDKI